MLPYYVKKFRLARIYSLFIVNLKILPFSNKNTQNFHWTIITSIWLNNAQFKCHLNISCILINYVLVLTVYFLALCFLLLYHFVVTNF